MWLFCNHGQNLLSKPNTLAFHAQTLKALKQYQIKSWSSNNGKLWCFSCCYYYSWDCHCEIFYEQESFRIFIGKIAWSEIQLSTGAVFCMLVLWPKVKKTKQYVKMLNKDQLSFSCCDMFAKSKGKRQRNMSRCWIKINCHFHAVTRLQNLRKKDKGICQDVGWRSIVIFMLWHVRKF